MKTKFRVSANDTIKAMIFSNNKLVSQLYDSGFTTINQVKTTLKNKLNDYNKKGSFTYSILNETKDTYWSNR